MTGSSALPFKYILRFHPLSLALTAIATTQTLFAEVIRTRIFRAVYADAGGRLTADTARECHCFAHCLLLLAGAGAGCRLIVARQRCASRSATANSCSRCT